MTLQIKCNCCEKDFDLADSGFPPEGFRTIYTNIVVEPGHAGASTCSSEVCHSCPDCNSYMSVDEHLEAEHDTRRQRMSQPRDEGNS